MPIAQASQQYAMQRREPYPNREEAVSVRYDLKTSDQPRSWTGQCRNSLLRGQASSVDGCQIPTIGDLNAAEILSIGFAIMAEVAGPVSAVTIVQTGGTGIYRRCEGASGGAAVVLQHGNMSVSRETPDEDNTAQPDLNRARSWSSERLTVTSDVA